MNSGFDAWASGALLRAVLLVFGWALSACFLYWGVWLFSLPLRRRERARVFLDLFELGLRDGRGPAATLQAISECRDRSLGLPFHQFAAHLRSGCDLDEALRRTPRLLPPGLQAMLSLGRELGDWRAILPACRQTLADGQSQSRSSAQYFLLLLLFFSPFAIYIALTLSIFVLPRFYSLLQDFGGTAPQLDFLRQHLWIGIALQTALMLALWLTAVAHVGGNRLTQGPFALLAPLVDRAQLALPWRRLRLRRDFITLLAILLDAGVPEPRAVELAAGGTANRVFQARARRAVARLAAGDKLPAALTAFGEAEEFHWRLRNGSHAPGGFLRALRGWTETLDARAFRWEQAFSQGLSTGVVVFNGLLVGTLAYCVFGTLTHLLEVVALW